MYVDLYNLCSFKWLPCEAPIEWLVEMQRRSLMLLWLFVCVGFLFLGAIAMLSGHYIVGISVLAISAVTSAAVHTVSFKMATADSIENFTLVLYLFVAGSFAWVPFYVAEPVYRHRSMGMNLVVWRAVLPYSGLRIMPAVIFLVATAFNEALATCSIASRYGDLVPIRVFVVIFVVAVMFVAPVIHQQTSWRTLYEAERQVVVEKEATDSLLAMICDATFWIAADGNNVLRSDSKLDSIMGCSMQGANLMDFLPNSELERYVDAFSSEAQAEPRPVILLPTSLLCKPADRSCKVDLFINDRRHAFAAGCSAASMHSISSSQKLGFLVGVRLIDQISLEVADENDSSAVVSGSNNETGEFITSPESAHSVKPFHTDDHRCSKMRHARQSSEMDASSTLSSSSFTSRRSKGILKKSFVPSSAKDLGTPVGSPARCSGPYMMQCTERLLIDLVSAWNFRYHGCCHWHAAVGKLEGMVQKLHSTYRCCDKWSPSDARWQCPHCTGLMTSDDSDCWLCYLMGVENQACDSAITLNDDGLPGQGDGHLDTDGLRHRRCQISH